MKGQATIEYMLVFGASLALISLVAFSLSKEGASLRGKADYLEMACRSEAAARAVEAMHSCGIDMEFDFRKEGLRYSIESGRFHADYGGKTIEIDGVFIYDAAEPV